MSPAPTKASPTSFPDLNELLEEFVDGVREALQENFVGAYLVGSFALGAADEWSDADFVVVTESEPDPEPLNALHSALFARDNRWAHHLEGSYVPRGLIRAIDPARTQLWFLDHGSSELARDEHCNTALVRWTLFHHGVTLAGPEPQTLVDPVGADDLRAEARVLLGEHADWAAGRTELNRWLGPYIVLTLCRLRYTLANGAIVSKQVAGEWALEHVDAQWHDLVRAALVDRPDPVGRWYTAFPAEETARTHAFVEAMR